MSYYAILDDLYEEVLNYIRKDTQKEGVSVKAIMKIVYDYFKLDDNSEYADLVKYIRYIFNPDRYAARKYLPHIILAYDKSNYEGSVTDFGKAYIIKERGTIAKKQECKDMLDALLNSLDWEKHYEGDLGIPLCKIKGTGVCACTELALALNNCLSFLGYDTFMLGGNVALENGTEEHHNYVVVKNTKGEYILADTALLATAKLDTIKKDEDLTNFGAIETKDFYGRKITYYSKFI